MSVLSSCQVNTDSLINATVYLIDVYGLSPAAGLRAGETTPEISEHSWQWNVDQQQMQPLTTDIMPGKYISK